jgi:hypothetical protein
MGSIALLISSFKGVRACLAAGLNVALGLDFALSYF